MVTKLEMQEFGTEIEDLVSAYIESQTYYTIENFKGKQFFIYRCRQCESRYDISKREQTHTADCEVGKLKRMATSNKVNSTVDPAVVAVDMAEIHALLQFIPEGSDIEARLSEIYSYYGSSLTTSSEDSFPLTFLRKNRKMAELPEVTISTKGELHEAARRTKELVSDYLSQGYTNQTGVIGLPKDCVVKRCNNCTEFSEYTNAVGEKVTTPHHEDGCDMELLEIEVSRQDSAKVNTVDLLDGSSNLGEFMRHIPPGTKTWGELMNIRRGHYKALGLDLED